MTRRILVCATAIGLLTTAMVTASDVRLGYGGYAGLPIPDNSSVGATYAIQVSDSFLIADLNVRVGVNHELLAEVDIEIEGPGGEIVRLWSGKCGSENNLHMVFDDEGAGSKSDCSRLNDGLTIAPAYTGFESSALGIFDGQDAQGTWYVRAFDRGTDDTGTLARVILLFQEDTTLTGLEATHDAVVALSTDVADLAGEVGEVETKVEALAVDVATANSRLIALQNDVDQLQADVTDIRDTLAAQKVHEIERALLGLELTAELMAPAPYGSLEQVRDVVVAALATVESIGESTHGAASYVDRAETYRLSGRYRDALREYARAYCYAVSSTARVRYCN